jgi:hypothetical protein
VRILLKESNASLLIRILALHRRDNRSLGIKPPPDRFALVQGTAVRLRGRRYIRGRSNESREALPRVVFLYCGSAQNLVRENYGWAIREFL